MTDETTDSPESELTLADRDAQREDICGVFCENEPEVTFTDERGITVHWCRDCYEKPCSHCGGEIEDKNKRKGMCQDRRDEIRMWGGDEERGIEKDPESEQTTLLTDGGTDMGGTLQVVSPRGETPSEDVACADCGAYRTLVGPLDFDGRVSEGGDFVCRSCTEVRSVDADTDHEGAINDA